MTKQDKKVNNWTQIRDQTGRNQSLNRELTGTQTIRFFREVVSLIAIIIEYLPFSLVIHAVLELRNTSLLYWSMCYVQFFIFDFNKYKRSGSAEGKVSRGY